jgi:sporulation protein YlmC with PRC-barrel domain
MIDRSAVLQSRGSTVVGNDGQKIGNVEDIYLDRETGEPEWAMVKTGLFGPRGTFVPLAEATMQGSDIAIPYGKDQVKSAPNMDPDGELSQEQEAELYSHYDLDYADDRSHTGLPQARATKYGTETRLAGTRAGPLRTTR